MHACMPVCHSSSFEFFCVFSHLFLSLFSFHVEEKAPRSLSSSERGDVSLNVCILRPTFVLYACILKIHSVAYRVYNQYIVGGGWNLVESGKEDRRCHPHTYVHGRLQREVRHACMPVCHSSSFEFFCVFSHLFLSLFSFHVEEKAPRSLSSSERGDVSLNVLYSR
jgi:hypothetical protein